MRSPKPKDLTSDLRRLKDVGALPDGMGTQQAISHTLRSSERKMAFDPFLLLTWTVASCLLLGQFALIFWLTRN